MPSPGPFAPLLAPGDTGRLQRIATILRLAEGLERGRDGTVQAVELRSLEDGSVLLGLRARGEAHVPMWAAARETELFERAFGTSLVVDVL